MRITILAFGARGDIQPFIALGVGLQDAGHTVRLVTHATFEALANSYGLDCATIDIDLRRAWGGQKKAGFRPFATYRLVREVAANALNTMWEGSRDAEALIFNYMGRIPGMHIAEKLSVPTYIGLINPQQMHLFYHHRYMSDTGEPVFKLKRIVMDWIQQLIYMPLLNAWRKQTLGLKSAPLIGNDKRIAAQQIPVLCSYSDVVSPKRPEWPAWAHLTGYWFLDHPADWQPPEALQDFLTAGPPPVCVGFSSVTHLEVPDMTERVVAALAQAEQRGILLSGWNALGADIALPESIFVTDTIPHDWLFPQVAAVVHHGGVGTTAAALRAGVPAVVVPFVVDEPFWGWRVATLGAGPTPIPPQELTAERLAAAITTAVHDETMRARAEAIGQQLRAKDGVARAVELFHHYLP